MTGIVDDFDTDLIADIVTLDWILYSDLLQVFPLLKRYIFFVNIYIVAATLTVTTTAALGLHEREVTGRLFLPLLLRLVTIMRLAIVGLLDLLFALLRMRG